MTGRAAPRGRPIRAMLGLAALFALWLGWRVPLIAAQLGEATAVLARVEAPTPPVPDAGPMPIYVSSLLSPGPAARPLRRAAQHRQSKSRPAQAAMLPATAGFIIAPELAATSPRTPPAAPAPAAADPAVHLAQQAYDRLRAGQRRQAAALFDAALRMQPDNQQWQADRATLARRWQLGAYSLLRDGGSAAAADNPVASPVLGGGQIGGSVAFVIDPYARRPLALVARANMAADPAGLRTETGQVALGIRQTLAPGVSIAAERLIALGTGTRSDWTLRLAAGGARGRFSGYGEAGVLGNGQAYAGAQAAARLLNIGPASLSAGSWASLQTGMPDVWRADLGPSLSVQWQGVRLQADWRQRVGGNAAPGSGPVVTISTGF